MISLVSLSAGDFTLNDLDICEDAVTCLPYTNERIIKNYCCGNQDKCIERKMNIMLSLGIRPPNFY